ncbi:hypothetical protein ACH4LE_04750 [Streptomyces sp. NPDC017413]|uniref:hypothetical protein n=1 Tax=Streptomyces sp. NPDC017413 TaxID=3364994 RepID=UPI003794971A
MKSVTRNQEEEGQRLSRCHVAIDAQHHPEADHRTDGRRRRDLAAGEGDGHQPLGPALLPAVLLHRRVGTSADQSGGIVRADHGRPGDGLAGGGEHRAGTGPDIGVAEGELVLQPRQDQRQRQEDRPYRQGQRPGVAEHHGAAHRQLAAADQQHAAELAEDAELVHVAGSPGHQIAALLAAERGPGQGSCTRRNAFLRIFASAAFASP